MVPRRFPSGSKAFVAAAITIAGLIGACNNGPRSAVSPTPTAATPPFGVGVDIIGPASIPPGQSAQFSATLRFGNGTSQAATGVEWSTTNPVLLRVDASGIATAAQWTGEVVLNARVTGPGAVASGSREIVVLPDGTFRMAGVVSEVDSPEDPVVGARVEVTGMPLAATTDWDGGYRLYGVPGVAEVRVTRTGYQPHVERQQLTDHSTRNFRLALAGARLELHGAYTLTIDVASCYTTPLPSHLRRLSYDAFVRQKGPTLEVALTESARFLVNPAGRGDRFAGHADAAGALFNLQGYSGYYYYKSHDYANLVERLSDGTYLVVAGTAATRSLPAGLSGDLKGRVTHHDSSFPSVPLQSSISASCYSDGHRFTLTPR
jgi:hypothetical protein